MENRHGCCTAEFYLFWQCMLCRWAREWDVGHWLQEEIRWVSFDPVLSYNLALASVRAWVLNSMYQFSCIVWFEWDSGFGSQYGSNEHLSILWGTGELCQWDQSCQNYQLPSKRLIWRLAHNDDKMLACNECGAPGTFCCKPQYITCLFIKSARLPRWSDMITFVHFILQTSISMYKSIICLQCRLGQDGEDQMCKKRKLSHAAESVECRLSNLSQRPKQGMHSSYTSFRSLSRPLNADSRHTVLGSCSEIGVS